MSVLSKLLFCSCLSSEHPPHLSEKHLTPSSRHITKYQDNPSSPDESSASAAEQIVATLFAARANDAILRADLESITHTYGWYDSFAAAVLATLESAIKLGLVMGPAMQSAYDRAVAGIRAVDAWAGEHPDMAAVLVTLVALGVLAILMPWMLTWLGFAEEGVVEGELVCP
jgi:hypothetical protein